VILPLLLAWSAMTAMAREEATPADHALVDQVMHRLRAVAEPVAGFAWPPTFKVVPVIDGDEVSACAHNASKDYQVRPEIDVTDGLLRPKWWTGTPTAWRSSWGTSWGTSS
jgi:hypothetical protein